MESPARLPNSVCFGLFEADLASGELRRRGRKVPLQDQPFQVLASLLRHPGEIVTREQLQHALWPADTFVEFDHGVNTAIGKIRQALGDDADNPRFIETLPRKGYRFIAPLAGSEAQAPASAPTPAPPVRSRPAWIPAAVALAVIGVAASVWLLNRPGRAPETVSAPVPLTSYLGNEYWPSFSPEGDRVAFCWTGPKQDNADIYVKQIGESEPVRLTKDPAEDVAPAWSPDGRSIAFLRSLSTDRLGVFLIPAIGGPERKLAEICEPTDLIPCLSWHPGGRWLLVVDKSSTGEPPAVFLLSVETGEKRRLTSPPRSLWADTDPAVSPDGRALVFVRGLSLSGDLYLLELSGDLRPIGEPKRATFRNLYTASPAWYPDGRSVVFASGGWSAATTLWRIPIHGPPLRTGEPERLAFAGQVTSMPAISRQGRLAYVWRTGDADIWRLELTGSRREDNLPLNSTSLDGSPQYSPDGKRIVFASNRSGSTEIWVSNADGLNAVKLTSFGGPYVADPAWSPDGRRIAFCARPSGISEVYIVSADGGKPERLPGTHSEYGAASWSRDGKWIYTFSNRTGMDQVWKAPVGGGAAVQVTRNGGAYAVESPDGKFLYYSRAWEAPEMTELWRMPVEGGEETRILASVCSHFFAVVERGIYFFSGRESPSIQFFHFATGRIETVAKVEGRTVFGLSVSPDGRWLLYAKWGKVGFDLMLVEHFR